jgi:type IV pilus biogenesis protein CpaD/CtpE
MGCINAANIASMVAQPRVLTAPGSLRGSDGIAAADAVERYRTDNIKQPGRLRVLGD